MRPRGAAENARWGMEMQEEGGGDQSHITDPSSEWRLC